MKGVAIITLTVIGLTWHPAEAAPGQTVKGTVTALQSYQHDRGGCGEPILRTLESRFGLAPFVYEFDIIPATRGKRFDLRWMAVTEGSPVNLNIAFFKRWKVLKEYTVYNTALKRGTVPRTATRAALCVNGGEIAHFTYRAGAALSQREQRVAGSVALPGFLPCGLHAFNESVIASGAGRENSLQFTFDVDRASWGEPFTLTPASPITDMDIWFPGLGSSDYETRAIGGERGTVPHGATRAFICIFAGSGSGFTYVARLS